jgi:hypothetical protein
LAFRSETDLRIQIKELLFDNAYLSNVIDDKKYWFKRMEVLDIIYHQCFLAANTLGRQPTTSQFFQPLTLQTLAIAAAAIHCALSEYATGRKVTVMFSQDEYRGKVCPSTVIDCITAEAIAHIKFKLHMVGLPHTTPPKVLLRNNERSSIPVGTRHPRRRTLTPSVLISLDWQLDILFSSPYCRFSLPSSS